MPTVKIDQDEFEIAETDVEKVKDMISRLGKEKKPLVINRQQGGSWVRARHGGGSKS